MHYFSYDLIYAQRISHTLNRLVVRGNGRLRQARLERSFEGKFKIKGLQTSNPLAVGDRVMFTIEDTVENTVIIYEIEQRENYIIRKSVHKTAQGHILAANLDQAVIIATLNYPRTSQGFIDRFLVSAESFRIPVTIVFNKVDLLSEEEKDELLTWQQCMKKLATHVSSLLCQKTLG
jgi:ribosome biogenesis GTPase